MKEKRNKTWEGRKIEESIETPKLKEQQNKTRE